MASTMNSEKFSAASFFLPHSFNTPISLKLDDYNYLIWKQQVLATVKDLKLTKFLEGQDIPIKFTRMLLAMPSIKII